MPATSKKQYEMVQAIAHGWKGGPKGFSQAEAKKFVSSQPTAKGLPTTAPRPAKKHTRI